MVQATDEKVEKVPNGVDVELIAAQTPTSHDISFLPQSSPDRAPSSDGPPPRPPPANFHPCSLSSCSLESPCKPYHTMSADETRYHFYQALNCRAFRVGQFIKFPLFVMSMVLNKAAIQSLFGDVFPKSAYGFIVKNDENFITAIILGTSDKAGLLNKPASMVRKSFGLTPAGQPYLCRRKSDLAMIPVKPGDGALEVHAGCGYQPIPGTFGNVEYTICLPHDSRVGVRGEASPELKDQLVSLYMIKNFSGALPGLNNLGAMKVIAEQQVQAVTAETAYRDEVAAQARKDEEEADRQQREKQQRRTAAWTVKPFIHHMQNNGSTC